MDAAALRIFDNPFAGRALRHPLRSGRTGLLLMLHAGMLLLVVFGINRLYAWHEFRVEVSQAVGFGRALLAALALVEFTLLSLWLPFSCGLVLYTDRRNRCLDQLAASGLSPLSAMCGHIAAVMSAVLLHLIVALPYFSLCVVLGGVTLGELAAVLAMIVVYAFGVGCAAMALGTLQHFATPFLLIPLAAVLGIVAFVPDSAGVPSALAAMSPMRPLILMTVQHVPEAVRAYLDPSIAGVVVPCWLVTCANYALLGALALAHLALGPDVRFAPGLSDFDAITLGSRKGKRRLFWRGRLMIAKLQLAFLYENRPRWLKRYTPRLRQMLFLLTWTLGFALSASTVAMNLRTPPTEGPHEWWRIVAWRPTKSVPGYANEFLSPYIALTCIWAAALLPYTRRQSRERVLAAMDSGLRSPLDSPGLWHVLGLLAPAVVLGAVLVACGSPVEMALRPHTFGLWLMASAYSLTVGSLVSAATARVRYPANRNVVAGVVIIGVAAAPWIWYPFYLFGWLPKQACYLALASLPVGAYLTFEPWAQLDFPRLAGGTFSFVFDWRWVVVLHVVMAALAAGWSASTLRRLRKREEADRSHSAELGAGG